MRVALTLDLHFPIFIDHRHTFIIGVKTRKVGHVLHRAILPVGQHLELHCVANLPANKLLGENLQPIKDSGFLHIQLGPLPDPLEHQVMFPAAFLINLSTLVLHLLHGFLQEETLFGMLQINTNTVFLVGGNRLMIQAKVISEK